MAKKKKESEENIKDENQDINNIDENFGLPDLDYQPVDEIEEESVEEQESSIGNSEEVIEDDN